MQNAGQINNFERSPEDFSEPQAFSFGHFQMPKYFAENLEAIYPSARQNKATHISSTTLPFRASFRRLIGL